MNRYGLLFLLCLFFNGTASAASPGREVLSLDQGWRFHKGDIPFPVVSGHRESYNNAKAGNVNGAAAPVYDDSSWRVLDLPHDWAVEGGFSPEANIAQGYRERGYGWYRRQFRLPEEDRGKHLELRFDGIATYATIWVNGNVLHRNWCGYTSMYIDITPYATYGDDLNTIAVRVDATAQEGWWYEGAGIYRHTWLVKRSPLHVVTDGLYANPVENPAGGWEVPVEVALYNCGKEAADASVEVSLSGPDGSPVASGVSTARVEALREAVATLSLSVSDPQLWSPDTPVQYTVTAVIREGELVKDETAVKCGFRTVRFDKDTGFWLNGENLKIKGVCGHQDHAGVGVAVPDALWEYRLQLLKGMGVNAYRCAHNPMSREFMDACDSLGILTMAENRVFNTSPEYVRQLEWLVRRDRSRPGVILWSVFNEEPMQGTENGYEMVRRMSDIVKRLDGTRPVTAAMNGGFFNTHNVSQAVDVVGFNYQQQSYDRFRRENPDKCLTSAEDGCAFSVRGEYVTDTGKRLMDSYDIQHASWGDTHRNTWKAIETRPWIAGGFYWSAFDYRGEPTPYTWPSVSTFFGIMDLCGFPKSAYYIHQALWRDDMPVLQLIPHWNWPADSLGREIKVMALSNVDSVVLKLNGKIISGQKADRYTMNTWRVAYRPGKLEAIGYDARGKIVARSAVETTGEPASLRLTSYRPFLRANGVDAIPVTVEVLDRRGRPVPTAHTPVHFRVSGPGEIIGLGNGNPNSHEPEKGDRRRLFNGLAQVIVQHKGDQARDILLAASGEGLREFTLRIPVIPAQNIPSVPSERANLPLPNWIHTASFLSERPDPLVEIAENDMNSWVQSVGPTRQKVAGGTFMVYRTVFSAAEETGPSNPRIVIKGVRGKAEAWLNGKKVAEKKDSREGEIIFPVPPTDADRYDLRLILEGTTGQEIGFQTAALSGMILL